jgi:hypothetical protein
MIIFILFFLLVFIFFHDTIFISISIRVVADCRTGQSASGRPEYGPFTPTISAVVI